MTEDTVGGWEKKTESVSSLDGTQHTAAARRKEIGLGVPDPETTQTGQEDSDNRET